MNIDRPVIGSATAPSPLVFTDAAAKKVSELIQEEDNPDLMLRVFIIGGGCSGFQYGFSLDDTLADDDLTYEHDGVTVVVDEMSLGLLEGSEVDYTEDLGGAYFQVTNPNATSSCGCGSSFAI